MPTPFEVSIHARWPDMDQNGHMRTVAYLEVAEDSRMQYFASRGYSMDSFMKNRIGPVVTGDELQYRAELRLLDRAVIRLELAGLSADGVRFRCATPSCGPTGGRPPPSRRRSGGSTWSSAG